MTKQARKPGRHSRITRQKVFALLLLQTAVLMAVSGVLLLQDITLAYSALLGGAIFLIPYSYFAWKALSLADTATARQTMAVMYVSEIWKMAMTVMGFALAFVLVQPLSPFSLFGTYILMQVTSWLGQVWLNKRFLKL